MTQGEWPPNSSVTLGYVGSVEGFLQFLRFAIATPTILLRESEILPREAW